MAGTVTAPRRPRAGALVPTAQQIADRAGVGIRSFFRHFADMDSLFLAADELLISSYEACVVVPP